MFLGVIIEDDKIKLSEVTGNKMESCIITFHVPEGHEKECAEKFEEYNFVQWARFIIIMFEYIPLHKRNWLHAVIGNAAFL